LGETWDKIKYRIARFHRKWRKTFFIFYGVLILLFIFRKPIFRGAGNFLIKESPLEKADAIFVLGGNVFDRPIEAFEIYKAGYAKNIITLGANSGFTQLAMNSTADPLSVADAVVMYDFLLEKGVRTEDVRPIVEGTSTKEECEAILNYAMLRYYKKIIVVSDLFHTRRIHNVFVDYFAAEGIEVIVRGASHSEYDESTWWNYEGGLIMVNNEYVKLMFYFLKGY
jgi:uncharacterized SAM-binding protein YcdF (DUF218 family)